jgi:hypothetical protein
MVILDPPSNEGIGCYLFAVAVAQVVPSKDFNKRKAVIP